MKLLIWFKQLFNSLAAGIRRFPAAMLLSVAVAFILIWMNHLPANTPATVLEDWQRALIVCLMGFPATLALHLLLERAARPPIYKPVPFLIAFASFLPIAAGLFAYAWFLLPEFEMVPLVRTTLLTGALVLLFGCVPYWWRREGIALHATRLIVKVLVTILYSGILMLSLFAILFTLDKLLNVPMDDKNYADTAILVWSLFATFHFFAGLPRVREVPKQEDSPKTLRFLMHWILIPLLWVYTSILYVYSAKILIEREWPHGIVSSLILSYTCIGLLVWFLSSPTVADSKLAGFNHRWFAWSALPLFFVLFAAIGIRVGEYGLTEPRWFVLILGGWCAAATLFIAIRSLFRKRDPEEAGMRLILLPASLALVAISSVVGPFSAFNLSIRSQTRELQVLLEKNNMLEEGMAKKASASIPDGDRERIASILYWFDQDHDLRDAAVLPQNFTLSDAETKLGISLDGTAVSQAVEYVRFHLADMSAPMEIAGFDTLFAFGYDDAQNADPDSGLAFRMDQKTKTITLTQNGTEVYRENLTERFKELIAAFGTKGQSDIPMNPKDLTFDSVSGNIRFRLIFRQIDGNSQPDAGTGMNPGYAEGWLLVDLP